MIVLVILGELVISERMKYGSEDRTCIIRNPGVQKYHFIPRLYHDYGIAVCVYIHFTFAVGTALEMTDQVFIGGTSVDTDKIVVWQFIQKLNLLDVIKVNL